jgi:uncharacterized membrane protein YfcA
MDIAADPLSFALLAMLLAVTGLVAGLIAGLLGVGGGIVLVPVLEYSLRFAGFPKEWCMHVAVATSLATIIPTAIASSRAHNLRGGIDWGIVKAWAPGMILGGLAGSLLAAQASDAALTAVFGFVAALVAAKMFLPLDHLRLAQQTPRGLPGNLLAASIGGISSMMGIGGGTLSVSSRYRSVLRATARRAGNDRLLVCDARRPPAGAHRGIREFCGARCDRTDVDVDSAHRCETCALA